MLPWRANHIAIGIVKLANSFDKLVFFDVNFRHSFIGAMKIFFIFLLFTVFAIFSESSFSASPFENGDMQKKSIQTESRYSESQKNRLDSLLEKNDYVGFFNLFSTIEVPEKEKISYVKSKNQEGRPPLYWIEADLYAKAKNVEQANFWFYSAVIMTEQDSFLCIDLTAQNAARKLMRDFSDATDLIDSTTEVGRSTMPKVVFFIQNLEIRTNPSWACNLGDSQNPRQWSALIPKEKWRTERNRILDSFQNDFMKLSD